MEELKDGVIYANIAGVVDIELTVETLFQILDTIGFTEPEDEDYDEDDSDECSDCIEEDEEDEELDYLDIYEDTVKGLIGDKRIVAFMYDPSDETAKDRREYVGECLGVFKTAAEAERSLNSSKGCASKIANTWNYVLHNYYNGQAPISMPAKIDDYTRGQWSTNDIDFGHITFCYAGDLKHLLANDNAKWTFMETYME